MFGGAFDPPHVAHVALAQAACEQLKLDRLLVIPTGDAWHKTRTLTAAVHRVAMSKLAFDDIGKASVDEREIQRTGPSYTVDTLRELRAEHPDATLYLLMGADQARALPSWRDWEEVVRSAIICVADRPGNAQTAAAFGAGFPKGVEVCRIQMPVSPLSATQIRDHLSAQQSAENMVSAAVARYIADHHLYQSAR